MTMRSATMELCAVLVAVAACQNGGEAAPSREVSGGSPSTREGQQPGASAAGEPGSAAPIPAAAGLKEGDPAPFFSTTAEDGKPFALNALKGKSVVLYFYPKDDTPGCTLEAQAFRDDSDKYAAKGAVVLGVSMDDAASHKAFREKYHLNFPLLLGGSDLAKAYGVPVTGGYAARQTFVIGKDGKLAKIFPNVSPKGHSAEILAVLQ